MDSHFQDLGDAGDAPIDRNVLHLLAKHGNMSSQELKLAYHKSKIHPQRDEWLDISYRFFMAAGILLLMSGIIFFFAYNWGDLHKFAKLGLVQGGIVAIAGGLLFLKPSEFILKLGLTAISVLVGVAFAVYGQIYQTGADAYDFFLGWTIFVTAWVAISSFPFLWLFYLILINITLQLYLIQVHQVWSDEYLYGLIMVTINTIALAVWEYTIREDRKDWVHLLSIRIIGCAIFFVLTMMMFSAIFDPRDGGYSMLNVLWYLIWIVGGGFYYTQKVKDIAFTAMIAISLLFVGNFLGIRVFDRNLDDFIGIFFLFGIMNIVATVLLVVNLIRLHKKWSK